MKILYEQIHICLVETYKRYIYIFLKCINWYNWWFNKILFKKNLFTCDNFIYRAVWFHHSHKKQHSLETCARLFFMLLQDFFASARLHRVHKKKILTKSIVHYLCHLKSNNIIVQRKTTNKEKTFTHDWLSLT